MAIALQIDGGATQELTTIHIGSDDLTTSLRRNRAGVTLERYGVPVAMRTWKSTKVWNLNINIAPQSYIEQLRDFYEAGTFWLLPDADSPSIKYKVIWSGSFDPVYVKPGYYALQGVLRERI